jgi:GNAT superfamily N-acetyltransferase
MPQVLNDFSTPALVFAIKQNLYDLFDYLKQWGQTDFYTSPKLKRWWTPVSYPWYNGAMSLTPPTGDETGTIRETIDYFRIKRRGMFTWWLAQEVESSGWGAQLEANGLKPNRSTPGMAVDLDGLIEDINTPIGLEIKHIQDESAMKAWAHIFVLGYELPSDWETPLLDMLLKTGIHFPWHSYLATLNGEPVATAATFHSAGVVGIQMIATLPEMRGKGIGAAITLAPLLDARKMGFRIGILQSSDMGFKIYQRLGFKELCRMQHWYWRGGA